MKVSGDRASDYHQERGILVFLFLYMPSEHSENLEHQRQAIALF